MPENTIFTILPEMSSNVSIDGFEMEMDHKETNFGRLKKKAIECFSGYNIKNMIVSTFLLVLASTCIYQITKLNHVDSQSKAAIDANLYLLRRIEPLEERLAEFDVIMVQKGLEPYLPFGPQQHVPIQLVKTGGWKECFSLSYDVPLNVPAMWTLSNSCTASKLMLACRMTNHTHITALAWGSREKVLSLSLIHI